MSSAAIMIGVLRVNTCNLNIFRLQVLTHKAPVMTAADDIHKYFFHNFSEKIRLDISCESLLNRGLT